MALSRKNSRPLLASVTRFEAMQEAEFQWWRRFMSSRTATARMLALYGARYMDFFFNEFERGGKIVEYGSGPIPVMITTRATEMLAVDPLYPRYIDAGLVSASWVPWYSNAEEVPDDYFDTAFLLNVLDHTDDPESLIAHARRSLLPGGQALVFVHLEQEDEKHLKVSVDDIERWFDGWMLERETFVKTSYDPEAYLAVYRG